MDPSRTLLMRFKALRQTKVGFRSATGLCRRSEARAYMAKSESVGGQALSGPIGEMQRGPSAQR